MTTTLLELTRLTTAFHEAGHVVAACAVGARVIRATIVRRDDASGQINLVPERDIPSRDAAMVCAAGVAAVSKLLGNCVLLTGADLREFEEQINELPQLEREIARREAEIRAADRMGQQRVRAPVGDFAGRARREAAAVMG